MTEIPEDQAAIVEHVRLWASGRVREIRENRGLTQQQLADKMGVHFTRVSDLENNRSDFKCSTLFRAAAAMGVRMETLFRGCPDWRGSGKKDPEAVVVVTEKRLEEILLDCGVTPTKANAVLDSVRLLHT